MFLKTLKTVKALKIPFVVNRQGHPNNKAMHKTLPNLHATYVYFKSPRGEGEGGSGMGECKLDVATQCELNI